MAAKRILLAATAILTASVLALVGVAGMDNTAHAQSGSLKPANVQAVNGPNAGEAIVSWDAVTSVTWYRVGWISQKDYLAAVATGGDALQSYVFADVQNTTTYTVVRLEPGENYFFTVASIAKRFGASSEVALAQLPLNSDTSACPAPTPGVTPSPTPTGTATPTPTTTTTPGATATPTPLPAVTGGDYDHDDDGLIEIRNLDQLDAIRHDLDGNGAADDADNDASTYAAAFPGAAISMGCPTAGCTGYELATNLDYGTQVSAQGWQPIGYWRRSWDNAGFTATFDGGGYTISNLFISRTNANHVGLFAFSDGIIKRAALLNVNVVGNGDVGGLAGLNRGTIADSYVTGNVIGSSHNVGGLVGRNFGGGAITNSYATSGVIGVSLVGGLVGQNNSTITGSHATGSVTSDGGRRSWDTDDIGGLVGRNSGGTIAHSYSTGEALPASTTYTRLGGLVGNNTDGGGIADSHSTRSVTGGWYSGGLVGHNENGTITRSYATGAVSGSSAQAGGLVGSNSSAITASYATGNVSGGNELIGGLVGKNTGNGTVTASYAGGDVFSDKSIDTSQNVGGLAGQNEGTINGSYATGNLFSPGGHCWSQCRSWETGYDTLAGLVVNNSGTITGSYSTGEVSAVSGAERIHLSGFVQSNSGVVVFSYWDTQTSGQATSAAGVGKTTAQLQTPTGVTGIYASWNPNWWDFGNSSQYPVLKVAGLSVAAQRGQVAAGQPGGGNGTPASQDRAALVALYQATGGANWANNVNWLSDQPVRLWHGVATNADGRVTKLNLQSNGLRGQIPSELGNLENLTHLNLSHNDLGGGTENIDDLTWLVELSNLTHLDLSHNRRGSGPLGLFYGNALGLNGEFPLDLASNEKLTYINLANNLFKNDLDELLNAFSNRAPGSEIDLHIQHNTWITTSDSVKGMDSWAGKLRIEERDEFTSDDLAYLNSLMSTYQVGKGNVKLIFKVLEDAKEGNAKGSEVYKVAKLVCMNINDCNNVMAEIESKIKTLRENLGLHYIDNLREVWGMVPRTVKGVATTYYDVTIFSNPMVQDLMESIVLGWLNAWSNKETWDHFLASVPYFKDRKATYFELKYYGLCKVQPGVGPDYRLAWCHICEPAYDYALSATSSDPDAKVQGQYSLMKWCDDHEDPPSPQ